jgi:hypothetical protein
MGNVGMVYFEAIWYFCVIGYILWSFGIFWSHLVHFSPFWYLVSRKLWQPPFWVRVLVLKTLYIHTNIMVLKPIGSQLLLLLMLLLLLLFLLMSSQNFEKFTLPDLLRNELVSRKSKKQYPDYLDLWGNLCLQLPAHFYILVAEK